MNFSIPELFNILGGLLSLILLVVILIKMPGKAMVKPGQKANAASTASGLLKIIILRTIIRIPWISITHHLRKRIESFILSLYFKTHYNNMLIDQLYLSSVSNPYFQIKAATIAPNIGATKNNHNCERAFPPANNAGPKLRAGFTEVPVIGIATR